MRRIWRSIGSFHRWGGANLCVRSRWGFARGRWSSSASCHGERGRKWASQSAAGGLSFQARKGHCGCHPQREERSGGTLWVRGLFASGIHRKTIRKRGPSRSSSVAAKTTVPPPTSSCGEAAPLEGGTHSSLEISAVWDSQHFQDAPACPSSGTRRGRKSRLRAR